MITCSFVTLFVNLPHPKKKNLNDLKETNEDKKNKYSCLPSNNDAVKMVFSVAINGNHIIEELVRAFVTLL
jgi:hypothetical protein